MVPARPSPHPFSETKSIVSREKTARRPSPRLRKKTSIPGTQKSIDKNKENNNDKNVHCRTKGEKISISSVKVNWDEEIYIKIGNQKSDSAIAAEAGFEVITNENQYKVEIYDKKTDTLIGFADPSNRNDTPDSTSELKFTTSSLICRVSKAGNLLAADTSNALFRKRKPKSSDPFCEVRKGSLFLYKTKVINKSLDPVWDEVFLLDKKLFGSDSALELKITVKDYDRIAISNDFLGEASFIIKDSISEGKQKYVQKANLTGKRASGWIELEIEQLSLSALVSTFVLSEDVNLNTAVGIHTTVKPNLAESVKDYSAKVSNVNINWDKPVFLKIGKKTCKPDRACNIEWEVSKAEYNSLAEFNIEIYDKKSKALLARAPPFKHGLVKTKTHQIQFDAASWIFKISSASGLLAADHSTAFFGGGEKSSDPYCEVRKGTRLLYKTKVINKNLSPVWNESFLLDMNLFEADEHLEIDLLVKDYDMVALSNDSLGTGKIIIDKEALSQGSTLKRSVDLVGKNATGSVRFEIQKVSCSAAISANIVSKTETVIQQEQKEASSPKSKSSMNMNLKLSKVKTNWEEPMLLKVGGVSSEPGVASSLSLQASTEHLFRTDDASVEVFDKKSGILLGKVKLNREDFASKNDFEVQFVSSCWICKVCRAFELLASDTGSLFSRKAETSDPFCEIKCGSKLLYKTKVIKKNLNPEWNESFIVDYNLLGKGKDVELDITVKDYDMIAVSNDFLGTGKLNFGETVSNGKVSKVKLTGNKATGWVEIELVKFQCSAVLSTYHIGNVQSSTIDIHLENSLQERTSKLDEIQKIINENAVSLEATKSLKLCADSYMKQVTNKQTPNEEKDRTLIESQVNQLLNSENEREKVSKRILRRQVKSIKRQLKETINVLEIREDFIRSQANVLPVSAYDKLLDLLVTLQSLELKLNTLENDSPLSLGEQQSAESVDDKQSVRRDMDLDSLISDMRIQSKVRATMLKDMIEKELKLLGQSIPNDPPFSTPEENEAFVLYQNYIKSTRDNPVFFQNRTKFVQKKFSGLSGDKITAKAVANEIKKLNDIARNKINANQNEESKESSRKAKIQSKLKESFGNDYLQKIISGTDTKNETIRLQYAKYVSGCSDETHSKIIEKINQIHKDDYQNQDSLENDRNSRCELLCKSILESNDSNEGELKLVVEKFANLVEDVAVSSKKTTSLHFARRPINCVSVTSLCLFSSLCDIKTDSQFNGGREQVIKTSSSLLEFALQYIFYGTEGNSSQSKNRIFKDVIDAILLRMALEYKFNMLEGTVATIIGSNSIYDETNSLVKRLELWRSDLFRNFVMNENANNNNLGQVARSVSKKILQGRTDLSGIPGELIVAFEGFQISRTPLTKGPQVKLNGLVQIVDEENNEITSEIFTDRFSTSKRQENTLTLIPKQKEIFKLKIEKEILDNRSTYFRLKLFQLLQSQNLGFESDFERVFRINIQEFLQRPLTKFSGWYPTLIRPHMKEDSGVFFIKVTNVLLKTKIKDHKKLVFDASLINIGGKGTNPNADIIFNARFQPLLLSNKLAQSKCKVLFPGKKIVVDSVKLRPSTKRCCDSQVRLVIGMATAKQGFENHQNIGTFDAGDVSSFISHKNKPVHMNGCIANFVTFSLTVNFCPDKHAVRRWMNESAASTLSRHFRGYLARKDYARLTSVGQIYIKDVEASALLDRFGSNDNLTMSTQLTISLDSKTIIESKPSRRNGSNAVYDFKEEPIILNIDRKTHNKVSFHVFEIFEKDQGDVAMKNLKSENNLIGSFELDIDNIKKGTSPTDLSAFNSSLVNGPRCFYSKSLKVTIARAKLFSENEAESISNLISDFNRTCCRCELFKYDSTTSRKFSTRQRANGNKQKTELVTPDSVKGRRDICMYEWKEGNFTFNSQPGVFEPWDYLKLSVLSDVGENNGKEIEYQIVGSVVIPLIDLFCSRSFTLCKWFDLADSKPESKLKGKVFAKCVLNEVETKPNKLGEILIRRIWFDINDREDDKKPKLQAFENVSEEQKTASVVDDTNNKEPKDTMAVRIQAGFRGMMARKKSARAKPNNPSNTKTDTKLNPEHGGMTKIAENCHTKGKPTVDVREKETYATKIQASFRGMFSRKHNNFSIASRSQNESKTIIEEGNEEITGSEIEKPAIATNENLDKITRLQSVFRGDKARRYLDDKMRSCLATPFSIELQLLEATFKADKLEAGTQESPVKIFAQTTLLPWETELKQSSIAYAAGESGHCKWTNSKTKLYYPGSNLSEKARIGIEIISESTKTKLGSVEFPVSNFLFPRLARGYQKIFKLFPEGSITVRICVSAVATQQRKSSVQLKNKTGNPKTILETLEKIKLSFYFRPSFVSTLSREETEEYEDESDSGEREELKLMMKKAFMLINKGCFSELGEHLEELDKKYSIGSDPDRVIDMQNHLGKTLLHIACEKNHVATVALLIQRFSCGLKVKDNFGEIPVNYARNTKVLRLLQGIESKSVLASSGTLVFDSKENTSVVKDLGYDMDERSEFENVKDTFIWKFYWDCFSKTETTDLLVPLHNSLYEDLILQKLAVSDKTDFLTMDKLKSLLLSVMKTDIKENLTFRFIQELSESSSRPVADIMFQDMVEYIIQSSYSIIKLIQEAAKTFLETVKILQSHASIRKLETTITVKQYVAEFAEKVNGTDTPENIKQIIESIHDILLVSRISNKQSIDSFSTLLCTFIGEKITLSGLRKYLQSSGTDVKHANQMLHEVSWSIFFRVKSTVRNMKQGSWKRGTVVQYNEYDELLVTKNGRTLTLLEDQVKLLRCNSGDISLFERLKRKLSFVKLLTDSAAEKIQSLYRSHTARLYVADLRSKVQYDNEKQMQKHQAATTIQSQFRAQQGRKRKDRLFRLKHAQVERENKIANAASVIQSSVRAYQIRMGSMAKRTKKRENACTQLQKTFRGYLIRSEEKRGLKKLRALQKQTLCDYFKSGFYSRIAVDIPAVSEHLRSRNKGCSNNSAINFDFFWCGNKTHEEGVMSQANSKKQKQVLYGLYSEANDTQKADTTKTAEGIVNVLKMYGVENADSQLISVDNELSNLVEMSNKAVIKEKDLIQTESSRVLNLIHRELDSGKTEIVKKLLNILARATCLLHKVHRQETVYESLLKVVLENTAMSSAQNNSWKSFHYVQQDERASYCWISLEARARKQSSRRETLELQKLLSQEHRENSQIPIEVMSLALASGQLDFWRMGAAFGSPDNIHVAADTCSDDRFSNRNKAQQVQTEKVLFSASWKKDKFQLEAIIRYSKDVHGDPCRASIQWEIVYFQILSVLVTFEDSCLLPDVDKQKSVFAQINFHGINACNPSSELNKTLWLPSRGAKWFSRRQNETGLKTSKQSNDANEMVTYQNVLWEADILSDATWIPCTIDGYRNERIKGRNISIKQIRVTLPEGSLGWFECFKCMNSLRLIAQVDSSSDNEFQSVIEEFFPVDETPKLFTILLRELRCYFVECLITYEEAFKKMKAEEILESKGEEKQNGLRLKNVNSLLMPFDDFLHNLKSFQVLDNIQKRVSRPDDVLLLFKRFANRFRDERDPNSVSYDRWKFLLDPPSYDVYEAMRKALRRTKGFNLLCAKFRVIDKLKKGIVSESEFIRILIDEFESHHVTTEEILKIAPNYYEKTDSEEKPSGKFRVNYLSFLNNLEINDSKKSESDSARTEGIHLGKTLTQVSDTVSVSNKEDERSISTSDEMELKEDLVDSDEEEFFGAEFIRSKKFRNGLSELRYTCLLSADPGCTGHYDLQKPFNDFDKSGNGKIELKEFKDYLTRLGMRRLIESDEDFDKFVHTLVKSESQSGVSKNTTIDFAAFTRIVGYKRPKNLQQGIVTLIVRWQVELYFPEEARWRKGVATRYREVDRAIDIELSAFGEHPTQSIGFLSLNEYPIVLIKNLWGLKPWGRDPFFRKLSETYSTDRKALIENALHESTIRSLSSAASSKVSSNDTETEISSKNSTESALSSTSGNETARSAQSEIVDDNTSQHNET